MNGTGKCLFGGALLSAGLSAPQAIAQNFNISNAFAVTYAIEHVGYTNQFNYAFANGPFNVQSNANNQGISVGAYASGSNTSIRTSAFINSDNGATGRGFGENVYAYFTVDQNVNAKVSWDWTAIGYGYLRVTDLTNSTDLFNLGPNNASAGNQLIGLVTGDQYVAKGYSGVNGGTQSSFWDVSVPAPGSAGLLGLAGLNAARRKRPTSRPSP